METVTKYENLTGKEVSITKVSFINEDDGKKYPYLGIKMFDYVSIDLVFSTSKNEEALQIFVDYVNQFKWLTKNQLDSLCKRFVEIYWQNFSKKDVVKEFGI